MIRNRYIYKVLTPEQWLKFQTDGVFTGSPIDRSDGYIHLSCMRELKETMDKWYADNPEVVVLQVESARVADELRYEMARGGIEFPHLYADLPMSAVGQVWVLSPEADGYVLPISLESEPLVSLIYKTGTALLRRLPAERAHVTTVKLLRAGLGPKGGVITSDMLKTNVGGLELPNPVGLAAGFDKDCDCPDAMLGAGFGFVECGTVTPRPQQGNPQPRLFRLYEDEAVINRMGFNNRGLDHFSERLRARKGQGRKGGIVGANLGANKDSDDRAADYVTGLTRLWGHADYFTINISSPNTPGLRKLQGADEMEDLLGRIAETRASTDRGGAQRSDFPESRAGC